MGEKMAAEQTTTDLSEQAFLADTRKAKFELGFDKRRWRLIEGAAEWPAVCIAVSAAPRPNAPDEYAFRFDLSGYPELAPTARLWDTQKGAPLIREKWPGGKGRVIVAFNPDWNAGTAVYLPCDRVALVGHDAWRQQHPHLLWSPNGDITQFLWILYDLLNSSEYEGLRSS
jgi:hypothetical protein